MNIKMMFRRIIGKVASPIYEKIKATEEFQRIFFRVYENIEKKPPIVKDIFLSNIVRRTLSHLVYQTIDEKKSSFHKEKISTPLKRYSTPHDTLTQVNLDPLLVKRSKAICLHISNNSTSGVCEVNAFGRQYYFEVPPQTTANVQLQMYTNASIILLTNHGIDPGQNVEISIDYVPL